MRTRSSIVLSALIAPGVCVALGQSVAAAPKAHGAAADPHVIELAPTSDMGTQAAGGGGRSRDFTGDEIPDILARSFGNLVPRT